MITFVVLLGGVIAGGAESDDVALEPSLEAWKDVVRWGVPERVEIPNQTWNGWSVIDAAERMADYQSLSDRVEWVRPVFGPRLSWTPAQINWDDDDWGLDFRTVREKRPYEFRFTHLMPDLNEQKKRRVPGSNDLG